MKTPSPDRCSRPIPPRVDADFLNGAEGSTKATAISFRFDLLPVVDLEPTFVWNQHRHWMRRAFGSFEASPPRVVTSGANHYMVYQVRLQNQQEREVWFDMTRIPIPGQQQHPQADTSNVLTHLWNLPYARTITKLLSMPLVIAIAWASGRSEFAEHNPIVLAFALWLFISLCWVSGVQLFYPDTAFGTFTRQLRGYFVFLTITFLPLIEIIDIWHTFPSCAVIIENHSPHDVTLNLSGEHWMDLASGKACQRSILTKHTQVTVKDANTGEFLAEHTIQAYDTGPFLLNVLGAGTYYSGQVAYSPYPAPESYEIVLRDPWISADVDHLFSLPPVSFIPDPKADNKVYIRSTDKPSARVTSSASDLNSSSIMGRYNLMGRPIEQTYLLRHSLNELDHDIAKQMEEYIQSANLRANRSPTRTRNLSINP